MKKQINDEYCDGFKLAAGENWNNFVELVCIKNDLGGIENLSMIPGNVGSAPVQNIGAYGRRTQRMFFYRVKYYNWENGTFCQ